MVSIPKDPKDFLDSVLVSDPPDFGFKWNRSIFYWILAKIWYVSQKEQYRNLAMVPLYAKIMSIEMGREYLYYLDYLKSHKIIETDNYYRVGAPNVKAKCKCYRISPLLMTSPRNDNAKSPIIRCKIESRSVVGHFIKWRNETFGGEVNDNMLEQVLEYMDHFTVDEIYMQNTLDEMKTLGKYSQWDEKRYEMELNKVKAINSGREGHHVKIDAYGRHHTNFTNLCKPIRENNVLVDGEPTKSIDIVSAQANFVGTLCSKFIDGVEAHAKKLESDGMERFTMDPIGVLYNTPDLRESYISSKNFYSDTKKMCDIDPADVPCKFDYESYSEMATLGRKEIVKFSRWLTYDIYDCFRDAFLGRHGQEKTRDEIKKMWIKYIFGQPEYANKKMKALWVSEFPVLDKILDHFKMFSHKTLAHKLQRIESDIIFNHVCPAIKEQVGIPYITIHDSIMVAESKHAQVKDLFARILSEKGILSGVK